MAALIGPKVNGYSVGSWCPTPDGSGKPVAVAISLDVSGIGDIVVRLKTPDAVDNMVQLLLKYKQEVWPETVSANDGQHRYGGK
jgi:hypothetical protein